MSPADLVAWLAIINGLVINGQKLAITLGGEELSKEDVLKRIDSAELKIALNRDND